MAHEPQRDHLAKMTASQEDNDEIKDLQMEIEYNGFYDQVVNIAERFATTHIGQYVIERSDRMLHMIEDTAKWSLPQDEVEEKLVRPFGWITFLMLIVLLRFVRVSLSIAALMIGNSPVSAHDMVYFFQTRRRKLRAIRLHGLREMRRREIETKSIKSGANKSGGFTGKISALLSIAICRPGQHREPGRRVFVRRGQSQECEIESDRQTAKRPRDDDAADLNLTVDQMLSKYADENSEDDSDFLPPEDEQSNDESATSGNDTSCSITGDELNKEIVMQNSQDNETSTSPYTRMDNMKSQLNQTIEIKENGGMHFRPMPKPIMEIKREPLSDIDSGTEQQQSPKLVVTPINGNGEEQQLEGHNDISSPPENRNLNVHHVQEKKSTPGHESAALIKPVIGPSLNTTATVAPFNDENPNTTSSSHPTNSNMPSASLSPFQLALEPSKANKRNRSNTNEAVRSRTPTPPPTPPSTPLPTVSASRPQLFVQIPQINLSAFDASSVASDSPTDDEFFSPIGSPPDFNTVFKPVSILKNPIVPTTEVSESVDAHSTPKSQDDMPESPPTDNSSTSSPPKKHVQHQQPNKNRYRGKNRFNR